MPNVVELHPGLCDLLAKPVAAVQAVRGVNIGLTQITDGSTGETYSARKEFT